MNKIIISGPPERGYCNSSRRWGKTIFIENEFLWHNSGPLLAMIRFDFI
jgi:hypothetical protein